MLDNELNKEKDQYGFYTEDYYNEEFDEYGFNKSGIFLKKGRSLRRGDENISKYHTYMRYCEINVYADYIVARLTYLASDSVIKNMPYYGWVYYPNEKCWVNKPNSIDFSKFIHFLQHNATNQTFISLKRSNTFFHKASIKDGKEYDLLGYDSEGYDRNGFNKQGKDRDGYYRDGFNAYGLNKRGESKSDFSCNLIRDALLDPQQITSLSQGDITTSDFTSYSSKDHTYQISQYGIFSEELFCSYDMISCLGFDYGFKRRTMSKLSDHEKSLMNKMAVVPLCHTMINPWFFVGDNSAICLLLDLPYAKLCNIAHYSEYLVIEPGDSMYRKYDSISHQAFRKVRLWNENYNIKTGADAIYDLVAGLDLQKTLLDLKKQIKELDPDNIYETNRFDMDSNLASRITKIKDRINVITAFIDSGKSPLWMFIDNLPVIPIDLRPYMISETGQISYNDVNTLYRNVIYSNSSASKYINLGAPEEMVHTWLVKLQKAINALFNNAQYPHPVMNDATKKPCTSLKEIFFDRNGFFLDLLNGCDANQNE